LTEIDRSPVPSAIPYTERSCFSSFIGASLAHITMIPSFFRTHMPAVFGILAKRNSQTSYCLFSDNYQMNGLPEARWKQVERGWLLVHRKTRQPRANVSQLLRQPAKPRRLPRIDKTSAVLRFAVSKSSCGLANASITKISERKFRNDWVELLKRPD